MRRHELTDRQWAQLAPLLPPERPRTGRPNQDHRTIVNGIIWKLATGVPWRDVPERSGRGRPRVRPDRVVGDKGYTGRRLRAYCRRRGVRYTIPRQRRERRHGPLRRGGYPPPPRG